MAAFLLSYKAVYKDQNLPIQSVSRKNGKKFIYDPMNMHRDHFPKSNLKKGTAPQCVGEAGGGSPHDMKTRVSQMKYIQGCYSKRNQFPLVRCSSVEPGNIEKQLRSLDSYFGKIQDDSTLLSPPMDSSNLVIQDNNKKDHSISTNGLESLNAYLGKLNNGASQKSSVSSTYIELLNQENIRENTERDHISKQQAYVNIRRTKGEREGMSSKDTIQEDEVSNLYLIGTLASINIAVCLFEIASPLRNTDSGLFSIPLLYGAKINHLIVVGEWWRLVTPMFLVQD